MGKNGCVFWFSGLSGAGKSTISQALKHRLSTRGQQVVILDGDVLRSGLCSDLGFSQEDRSENLRRASELAAFLAQEGMMVICALISPYEADRQSAHAIIGDKYFHNVYIKADVSTCIGRDPKGLYQKALAGEIPNFTGISDPFEEPENPDLVLDTRTHTIEESIAQLAYYLEQCDILEPAEALPTV
jgi:adenylyl-sulfate kinase